MIDMETWYILKDGSVAPPRDVRLDRRTGLYRHKDGRAVSYRPDGATPRTRGVDPDAEAKARKKADAPPPVAKPAADPAKDMKPEEPTEAKPTRGYKTRETKAD